MPWVVFAVGLDFALMGGCSSKSAPTSDPRCGSNTKTIANRFLCLRKGASCSASTLPCCTDECESNDGALFNPNDDPAKYLFCDLKVNQCVLESESLDAGVDSGPPVKCKDAVEDPSVMCASATSAQCGPGLDGTVKCCPGDSPFYCSQLGKCYKTAAAADAACRVVSGDCVACVGATPPGECDAAGTWNFKCPASSSACGACGVIPASSASITVPTSVAASGGTFTQSGVTLTFDKAKCTVTYPVTCGRSNVIRFSGGKATMQTTFVCASGCVTCGATSCTGTR